MVSIMGEFCQNCGYETRNVKERWCPDCKKAVLAEMKASGYFQYCPKMNISHRTQDMQEDRWETKGLNSNPWQENVIRQFEDCDDQRE